MTLIELMVAVALLAIMIASFSMILNGVQKLVYGSEAAMRANAAASAVEYVIRKDIRSISMNGFLCIGQSSDNTPMLLYSTAGTSFSVTSGVSGDGCVTGLGLCPMNSGSNTMMWRGSWVLAGPSSTTTNDIWKLSFADIQGTTRQSLNDNIVNYIRTVAPKGPAGLPVPPVNLNDMGELWKYLAENCSNLTIMWTDGTLDGANGPLKWYGAGSPKGPVGADVNAKDGDGDYYIEFNDGGYRALWSQHNQNDWPKAIKISFTLNDVSKSTGVTAIVYEIICPLSKQ